MKTSDIIGIIIYYLFFAFVTLWLFFFGYLVYKESVYFIPYLLLSVLSSVFFLFLICRILAKGQEKAYEKRKKELEEQGLSEQEIKGKLFREFTDPHYNLL